MSDDELGEVSEAERREAEALQRALEGGAPAGAPDEALETAALLRHATGTEPAPARLAAVRERILREAAWPERPVWRWQWILPAGVAAAAATYGLVWLLWVPAPGPGAPAVPLDLLRAQAAAASGSDSAAAELRAEMGRYRLAFVDGLSRRYRVGG